jgi:hypothetical protein
MQCVREYRGNARTIYFLERSSGECPAREFLNQCTPADRGALLQVMEYHAGSLTWRNKKKFREIERTEFLEAKTRSGVRLLCFYDGQDADGRGRTVFINGLLKGSGVSLKDALSTAGHLRDEWLAFKNDH